MYEGDTVRQKKQIRNIGGGRGLQLYCIYFLWLRHMKISRPGIKSKLQLQTMPQLQQHGIINPLCQARDRTHTLMITSRGSLLLSHRGTKNRKEKNIQFNGLQYIPSCTIIDCFMLCLPILAVRVLFFFKYFKFY